MPRRSPNLAQNSTRPLHLKFLHTIVPIQVDIQSLQSKVQQNRIIEDYITQVEYFLNRIQKEQRCNVAVCRKRVVVYVATDSSAAVTAMRSWASAKDPAQRIHLAIRDTLTQNISGEKNEIAKLLQLEASFGYKVRLPPVIQKSAIEYICWQVDIFLVCAQSPFLMIQLGWGRSYHRPCSDDGGPIFCGTLHVAACSNSCFHRIRYG